MINITETKEKFYTCRYDRAFKEIMLDERNTDILKWLLESILKLKIKTIEVKTVERNTGNLGVRRKILDALLTTDIGKVQIEVNSNENDYMYPRNMAYIADIYSHDTLVGEEYTEDVMFIQINLTYGKKEEDAYKIYYMQDENGKKFVNNLKIYEFNMDFYKKVWDNNDKKLIEENKALVMLDLSLEELKKLSKEDRMVNKYMSNLEKINKDPEFREYMSLEEDFRKIRNSLLTQAKKEAAAEAAAKAAAEALEKGHKQGLEEGLKEGSKNTAIEIAKKMFESGMDKETIKKYTHIEIDDIEK